MIYYSLWNYYTVFRRYPISGLGFSELDSRNTWNIEQVRKSTWGRIYLLCVCDSEGSGSELNNLTGTESFLGDGRTQGRLLQESLTDNIQTLHSVIIIIFFLKWQPEDI